MNRARLLRYSPYQLKDFAIERVLIVFVLAALNLIGPIMEMRHLPAEARNVAPGSPMVGQVTIIFATLILLAVLFSSQDIVGKPRKLGYYRLWFAKPVDPVMFYAQLFVVHLVGSTLLLVAMAGLFSIVAIPVPILYIALSAALAFLLLGGVGMLISAFVNHDSMVLIVFVGLSILGKGYAAGRSGILFKLSNLLLPVDHVQALRPLILGGPVAMADVVWVAGYGMVAFVLAMIAVRYTQLAD